MCHLNKKYTLKIIYYLTEVKYIFGNSQIKFKQDIFFWYCAICAWKILNQILQYAESYYFT